MFLLSKPQLNHNSTQHVGSLEKLQRNVLTQSEKLSQWFILMVDFISISPIWNANFAKSQIKLVEFWIAALHFWSKWSETSISQRVWMPLKSAKILTPSLFLEILSFHHHHHHHFICKINKLHKEYTRYYVK